MNLETKIKEAKPILQKTKTEPEAFKYISIDTILKKIIKSPDSEDYNEDYSDKSEILTGGTSYPALTDPLSKQKKAKFDEIKQTDEIFDLT